MTEDFVKKEGLSESQVWGEVTDPTHHNSEDFRYLVHAFNPAQSVGAALLNVMAAQSGVDVKEVSPTLNYFEEPERIAERFTISMSLIDQNHRATWGSYGLIIEVPVGNMIWTEISDSGTVNASREMIEFQKRQHQRTILSGEQLLRNSNSTNYNEVVAHGSTEAGRVKLAGFFAKYDDRGVIDPEAAARLEEHAKRLSLPLIKIKEVSPFAKEGVEVDKNGKRVYINIEGQRYLLGEAVFEVLNARRESHFMEAFEFKRAIQFLRAQFEEGKLQLDEDTFRQLQSDYEALVKKRKAPKITHDKNGNIESCSILIGSGSKEEEFRFTRYGCWSYNLAAEREEMKRSLAQREFYSPPKDYSFMRRAVSAAELEEVLNRTFQNTDPETIEGLKSFYQDIKEAVQSSYQHEQRLVKGQDRKETPDFSFDLDDLTKRFYGKPLKIISSDFNYKVTPKKTEKDE